MEMSNSKLRNTHTQITAGLRQLAKDEGKNPNHVYNRFFREMFLAELMANEEVYTMKSSLKIAEQLFLPILSGQLLLHPMTWSPNERKWKQ